MSSGRKVSLPGQGSGAGSVDIVPLRRFSSSAVIASPPPKRKDDMGKITLNQYQLQGISCLQDQERAKAWIEAVLGTSMKNGFSDSICNGVVLCNLMNKVRPNSIPNIHQAKSQAFLALENINFFLSACLEMGVSFTDIFSPTDLYEKRNIPKVVKCILSVGSIATKLGFQHPLQYSPSDEVEQEFIYSPPEGLVIDLNDSRNIHTEDSDVEGESVGSEDDDFTFTDLDRTLNELDFIRTSGELSEDAIWTRSETTGAGDLSLEKEEQSNNTSYQVEQEYAMEELKASYPLVDLQLLHDLRHFESIGKVSLLKHQPILVNKYHYQPNNKDSTDVALADYINNKFSQEVPPEVSLPKPITRLRSGKYKFGDRIINLKLTNGSLLVRVGGGWMKLKEVLVRLNSLASCAALKEKTSILKINKSEWKTPSKPQFASRNEPQSPTTTALSKPRRASVPLIPFSLSSAESSTDSSAKSASDSSSNNLASTSDTPKEPEPKTLKPFPKIPPLKLPTKSNKPTLGTGKPTALSFFPANTPPKKNKSTSLPVSPRSSEFPKPKMSPQLSLPNLSSPVPTSPRSRSSSQPVALSSSASLSSSDLLSTLTKGDRSNRNSLPLNMTRSSSSDSVPSTPRRSTLSENQLLISINRSSFSSSSSSSSSSSPTGSPTTPSTPTSPIFPSTPHPATNSPTSTSSLSHSSSSIKPATPRYTLGEARLTASLSFPSPLLPSPVSSVQPLSSPRPIPFDPLRSPRPLQSDTSVISSPPLVHDNSPFRSPKVSLTAPKFASLKGKTS